MRDILIVDDEPISIMISEKLIKAYDPGLSVKGITSGAEALVYLERHQPDVIFLDIRMPVIDGFLFLDEMKERGFTTPVMLLTSSTSFEDKARSEKYANVLRYVTKPLNVAMVGRLFAEA